MTEHYYSKEQNVESSPRFWGFQLRGHLIRFKTDNGVFSKNEVDFGSRLMIETVVIPELNGDILDVGCGYGPIGLSLAKEQGDRTVHMVDVNERAINLAKENAAQNGITNISVYESYCLDQVDSNNFCLIITNPPIRAGKKVVHQIFEQSYEHLVPGGELWIVIQKKQGAPSAIEKLEQMFRDVEVLEKKKGYYIIKATKHLT